MKEKIHDPVCGREISRETKYTSDYNKERYYFHGKKCKMAFDKDPERVLARERSSVC